jgi:hypothetical protein
MAWRSGVMPRSPTRKLDRIARDQPDRRKGDIVTPAKGRSQDREPGDREPEHDPDIRLWYSAASTPAASAQPGAWHLSLLRGPGLVAGRRRP